MHIHNNNLTFLRISLDIFFVQLSFWIGMIASPYHKGYPVNNYEIALVIALLFLWVFTGKALGLYDEFRSRNFSYEFIAVLKNIFMVVLATIVMLFLFKDIRLARVFVFVFAFSQLVLVLFERYMFRKYLNILRKKGKNFKKILIVGAGKAGWSFYETIKANPHFGYKLVGFLDDIKYPYLNGEYLGPIDDLEKVIANKQVDNLIIALPGHTATKIDNVLRICNREAIRVRIIPDYLNYSSGRHHVSMFANFPIINTRVEPLEEIQWRLLKRLFDVLFSSLVVVLIFSWLFPLIALIQFVTSPGPLFFSQDRIGRDNKVFKCYKFRSMKVYASRDNNYKATEKNDPRITKLGRFLRKSNIDELPQIFNVLRGDMSIVGPRPHAISFNEKYSQYFDDIKLRHLVKPGITGWAQIHGLRGDVVDEVQNQRRTRKRIEYDIWYLQNWTFWLDLQIIVLTVWRMLKGDPNAY